MKCLVTGGAGFIGSHIAETLVRDGHEVRVLDNFSTGKNENLKFISRKISVEHADIRDFNRVSSIMEGVDIVFHQAGLVSVQESLRDPEKTHEINVGGTLNIFRAAVKSRVHTVVYASSCAVYGDGKGQPKKESMLSEPLSFYAESKRSIEAQALLFYRLFGLRTVGLRYFNVYGPRQASNSAYSGVISRFLKCWITRRRPTIYGDGNQTRDFIYVGDVVRANILAAKARKYGGEVFNVGTGRALSLNQIVRTMNKIFGVSIKPHYRPRRLGDIRRSRADVSKIRHSFSFKFKYDFERALQLTIDHFRTANAGFI